MRLNLCTRVFELHEKHDAEQRMVFVDSVGVSADEFTLSVAGSQRTQHEVVVSFLGNFVCSEGLSYLRAYHSKHASKYMKQPRVCDG